jgi:fucose permease
MGRVLFVAWMCHLLGILGTIFAQNVADQHWVQTTLSYLPFAAGDTTAYRVLWISTLIVGAGNGLVEIAINPLAATLFPREKTHYLNVLHAWWPGGLIMSGLLASFVLGSTQNAGWLANVDLHGYQLWQVKVGLLLVPLAIYGLLCVGQRFPQTERVASNVSTGEMFLQILRPLFLLWAFCMLLTASTELAPNQWQESVLKRTAHTSGTVVFVYTSALMFVMRFFAGPLAHKLSPVGMLLISSVLAAGGLYWLSYVDGPVMAYAAATLFGIGVAYYWPTMLGVTAERFPKGGALLLGLMGCVGNLAISQALPQMGAIYDSYTVADLREHLKTNKVVSVPKNLFETEETKVKLPPAVADKLYPGGNEKIDPKVLAELKKEAKNNNPKAEEAVQLIDKAEAVGAAWAFRWVSVLPCVLVIIFGLIAVGDRLRGGYKAVHLGDEKSVSGGPWEPIRKT